jgi:hypothetical protein
MALVQMPVQARASTHRARRATPIRVPQTTITPIIAAETTQPAALPAATLAATRAAPPAAVAEVAGVAVTKPPSNMTLI